MPEEEGPPPPLYSVPSLEDTAYWDRFVAVGLHNPEPAPAVNGTSGYTWIDLTDPAYTIPPAPPAIEGILYAGRRHVISGPPESTKTLVAYLLLLAALRQGEGVAILDFEMGPHACVTLLRELGATEDELAAIHYTEPQGPPGVQDVARLVGLGVGYVLLDAAAGAYDTTGLDDNSRKDAEQFAGHWIRPLWQAGVATLTIDHVVKHAESRGKFTIGSERKTGQADVHLSLEALKPLHRGGTGMVKINVMKDRPGHLPRPTAFLVDLSSDDTHQITWTFRAPIATEPVTGEFRHTIYMQAISDYLDRFPGESFSQTHLEENVKGKAEYIRAALLELQSDGFIIGHAGPRRSVMWTQIKPYDDSVPTPSPLRPDGVPTTPSHHVPPLRGTGTVSDAVTDTQNDPKTDGVKIDVSDPAIQALLDDPEF